MGFGNRLTGSRDERSKQLSEYRADRIRRRHELRERFLWHSLTTTCTCHVPCRELSKTTAAHEAICELAWQWGVRARDDVLGRTPANLSLLKEIDVGGLAVFQARRDSRDKRIAVGEAHSRTERPIDHPVRRMALRQHVGHTR